MFGKVVKRNTYYACQPPDGRRPDGHPVSVLVPEMPLIGFLGVFLNTHLLGPDRAEFLAATMTDLDQDTGAEYARRVAALDRQLADLTAKQTRLLRQAEDAEPGDPFAAGLRARYNELDLQRHDTERQRAALTEQPPPPSPATAQHLLARLPLGSLDPTGLPDEILRSLCDTFRITISYGRDTRRVRYTAEIEAGTISHLRDRLATPQLQICDVPPERLSASRRRRSWLPCRATPVSAGPTTARAR